MRIIEEWKAYSGPKDERIEREMNHIYKVGFIMLSLGILFAFYYNIMLDQVRLVFEVEATGSGVITLSLSELFVYVWLFIVCIVCLILQCRKGFVDNGRFGETDTFPARHFALISGMAGLVVGVFTLCLRTLATVQVFGYATLWLESALLSICVGVAIFALMYGILYLVYRAAKRRRIAQEAALEDN